MRQAKTERRPILKRAANAAPKKVTFAEDRQQSPARKEHKRLKSPPKENPAVPHDAVKNDNNKISDENRPKDEEPTKRAVARADVPAVLQGAENTLKVATANSAPAAVQKKEALKVCEPVELANEENPAPQPPKHPATSETLVTEHLLKHKAHLHPTPLAANGAENARQVLPSENKKSAFGVTVTKKEENEKAVMTEGEENKAEVLEMPKPKPRKQPTTSSVFAKMKALHKKRKAVFGLSGSERDLNKFAKNKK